MPSLHRSSILQRGFGAFLFSVRGRTDPMSMRFGFTIRVNNLPDRIFHLFEVFCSKTPARLHLIGAGAPWATRVLGASGTKLSASAMRRLERKCEPAREGEHDGVVLVEPRKLRRGPRTGRQACAGDDADQQGY